MRVACIGGGPGGLFFAILLKRHMPSAGVTVFERNRADDTFGFGVVFSDATLAEIHRADPVLRDALLDHGVHWSDIEVRLRGERLQCGGNGMAAIVRSTLLELLHRRAKDLGVDLRFETEADVDDLDGYDLIVGSDGANSGVRRRFPEAFETAVETASAKFIWFGTTYMFDGLTFLFRRSEHGTFAVHGYPISDDVSTFIVETDEDTWAAAGLDEFDVDQPPGPSDLKTLHYLQDLFAPDIDGRELLANNSRWGNFGTLRVRRWHYGRIALLGDAAHTAHFSVGSGTKMAMEDAISLADSLVQHPDDLDSALIAYEEAARPSVDRIQSAAGPSLSWWERFGRYHEVLEPWQFAIHFLTRSISVKRLERRDPAFVEEVRAAWRDRWGAGPLQMPLVVGGHEIGGRLVRFERDAAGGKVGVASADGAEFPLYPERGPATVPVWGRAIEAPVDPQEVGACVERGLEAAAEGAALIAVHGGSPLARTILSEDLRFRGSLPVLYVDREDSRSDAETLILTGRADLVAAVSGGDA